MKEIKKIKNKFRVLDSWKIEFDNKSKYKGQTNFNIKTKQAIIYGWEGKIPKDYLLHEILHIVFQASKSRKNEEKTIQDLTKILCFSVN